MTTQTAARKAEENDNSASKPKSPFIQETLQKLEILCDCLVMCPCIHLYNKSNVIIQSNSKDLLTDLMI